MINIGVDKKTLYYLVGCVYPGCYPTYEGESPIYIHSRKPFESATLMFYIKREDYD
jgi:hypothetical protein